MLPIIVLILIVVLLVSVLPTWPHTTNWGYAPSGALGVVLVIFVLLFLFGRL